jgi:uncharacterized protein YjiS (DUF1127 family)
MAEIAYYRPSTPAGKFRLGTIFTKAVLGIGLLYEWRRRVRSRRELAMYSYHERNDIRGAANVDIEIAKPFSRK